MADPVGTQRLDDLADLLAGVVAPLLAHVDRDPEARLAGGLDHRRHLRVVVAAAAGARPGDVDPDDPARRPLDRLLDDDRVELRVERPVHHQDQAATHLRVLDRGPVEPADRGEDDVVEVALAAAVALHRVEAQLERRDPLRAVGAADRRVHRALDRDRRRLDQLRPVVDRVERVEVRHAAGVGDRDEAVEVPVVLDRQRDPLLVGEAPEDLGRDRAAEVGVELREAVTIHPGDRNDDRRTRSRASRGSSLGRLAPRSTGLSILPAVKVGIVVPYSWSFWGAVVEHAELQAEALERLGCDVRIVMGNDPPGSFTRVLHPRLGRHGQPPERVIPVGRSVIVPANGSLPNIILSPRSIWRMRQTLERERFDVIHLHEPLTPTPCVAALSLARCPAVATFHASGRLALDEACGAGLGLPPRPARAPDRRLGAGTRHGRLLLARRVRDRPERRARPPAGRRRRPRPPRDVRRQAGAAEGPPRPPARLAGDPPRDRCPAARRRRRPARRLAPAVAARRRPQRDRRARIPLPGRADRGAARHEGAGGAVARRRELRDGAHARLRVRAPAIASDIPGIAR